LSESSIYCIQQDHGNCNGIITNQDIKYEGSKICNCPCHNSIYQLIKKASLALSNKENRNYFGSQI
jgi:Rieske Fe-S protein